MTGEAEIVLQPGDLYWLGDDAATQANDQCAHGSVRFSIGDTVFIPDPDVDVDDVTVTAAGLFLLRTLEHSHTASSPVAESSQLFPCCGFGPEPWSERFPVLIMGCATGYDPEVVRDGDSVTVHGAGGAATVSAAAWRRAVLGFCDDVEAFHERSSPRTVWEGEDGDGWRAFWDEWRTRRSAAP